MADAYKILGDTDLRLKYDEGAEVKLQESEEKLARKALKKERYMKRLMNRGLGGAWRGYGKKGISFVPSNIFA